MPLIESSNKEFLLHLRDNALVVGQRNSEWTGHGPMLEQDIAISNIALDLIGQSRNFYQYAAIIMSGPGYSHTANGHAGENVNNGSRGTGSHLQNSNTAFTEDSLAYLRE